MRKLPGTGNMGVNFAGGFREHESCGGGLFIKGRDGVIKILTPDDEKSDFILFEDKTLVYVRSGLGYPAIYTLKDDVYSGPAEAVLMDLDGTSVHSEPFWIWIIEQTMVRLLNDPGFQLEAEDEPHVSGHSVSEHLQYCIRKYAPGKTVEEARKFYFEITHSEMDEILEGRGRVDAFTPAPGLKEFLLTLKENSIRIGLVTSGLYEKAWPEVVAAFRTMDLGNPLNFYDAIITAGHTLKKGQSGTLGELSPKPHPWLYAETARIGLGITPEKRHKVIGLEDSSAGLLSLRLAGFSAIGIENGNIRSGGMTSLARAMCHTLEETLLLILK
jgi:beta-phosphoglucomutase